VSDELTPERLAQIEEICQSALDLDATSRAAYLAETCGDDAELRREVESLLAHERTAQHFLEEPALDVAAKALSTSGHLGEWIGPYEVVSLLGSGGMGDVYRARDTQLGRDVAIKVLPPIFLGDPERLARFHREARVLATMNHPHIGAIYGVEQDAAGKPALILELVEGLLSRNG
jgi:eukaryotic-like serine/threonine-protein kinase